MRRFCAAYLLFISIVLMPNAGHPAESSNTVEFVLSYPIVNPAPLVDYATRIYLSLTVDYQLFLTPYLGICLGPSLWTIPMNIDGVRRTVAVASFSTGLVFRALPQSYFDPRLLVWGGAGLSDAGKATPYRMVFPVFAHISASIYRLTSPYQDTALSLVALMGAGYHFNQNESIVGPVAYEAGLGLRGSF